MKKLSILILFLFITSISIADVITKTYHFDNPETVADGDYTTLQMEDSYHLGNPGEPSIPYKGITLLLPQNQEISNISVKFFDQTDLGNHTIYPVQQQRPLSLIDQAEFTPPDQKIYESDVPFPTSQYTTYSTHFLAGYSIGAFALTPFSYVPSTKELSFFKKAVVTIETSQSEAATQAQRFLHHNYETETRLAALVDNINMVNSYTISSTKTDGFDYIIITTSEFEDDYQVLADFHTMRGLKTKVELVNDIQSDFTGVDIADKIRNFIISEYTKYPVQYVLLGGDTDIIPHRGFYVDVGYGIADKDIPADLYYGCLDRTTASGIGPDWNNNNNLLWGEADEADLLAEVYIGRICANNSTEIANQINKIQKYLESPVANEITTSLLVGELLWSPPQHPAYTYGGSYMDELLVGSSSNGYTTVGIPGSWSISKLYQKDYSWRPSDLYHELNLGPNFLHHLGHGYTQHCLNIDNSNLTTYNLTNDGTTHNFYNGYSQACYSGSMDNRLENPGSYTSDCFMEVITNMPTAAASFVGNSRYGLGQAGGTDGASQHFHRQFIDVLFETGVYSVSGANQLSKEQTLPYITTSQLIRWCYYELNEFGDPALELWTAEPETLTPTYPQVIIAGVPSIDVTAPEGSRVIVYDDDTIYGYTMINSLGSETVFFDTVPTETGIIHIAIISHNYYKYVGDIKVTSNVVTINPDTIKVSIPTQVTVEVMTPDSTSPVVGVNIWAEGFDYLSETIVTDTTGTAVFNVNCSYGPTLQIYGQKPGDENLLFYKEINITALDLTNPSLSVTTNCGLVDTFALNLEGTVKAEADQDKLTLWIDVDGSGFSLAEEINYDVTPTTLAPVDAVIAKEGYNIYEEVFSVIVVYGSVSGIVTESQNSTPVSNAEVCFYEEGANPETDDPIFVSITDTLGNYTSPEEYLADRYDIYINKWGFNPYQKLSYLLGYGANTHDILLDPVTSSLVSGHVYDDHAMLSNATLSYVRTDNGEEYTSVQTNNGSYEVTLPYFTYTLLVTAEGHVPYEETFIVDGDQEHDYHLGFPLLFDNAEDGLSQWTTAYWDTTSIDYVSASHSFTDSPHGDYPNNTTTTLQLNQPINLSDFEESVNLYFDAKWDTEPDFDYAQVQASIDGSIWTALEGKYTEPGTGRFQPNDEPVYDGEQLNWVAETSNLSDFAGQSQVYIRFLMKSDYEGAADGIYVDNFLIGDPSSSYEDPDFSNDDPIVVNQLTLNQNFPNPVRNSTTFSFALPQNIRKAELAVYNIRGQLVKSFTPNLDEGPFFKFEWNGKDSSNKSVANGVYFYRLTTDKSNVTKKLLLLK